MATTSERNLVSRFGDDVMKRAFANLKGKRLVTVHRKRRGGI